MVNKEILDKLLALQNVLPKDLYGLCDIVWQAFYLGIDYQRDKKGIKGIEGEKGDKKE